MFKLEAYDSYDEEDFQFVHNAHKKKLGLPIDKITLNPHAPTFIPKEFNGHFDGYYSFGRMFDDGYYPYREYGYPGDMYYNSYGDSYYDHPHKQHRRTRKQRKYSYRSKQNKINVVLNNLKRKFSNNGKLARGEVLRGEDTLRIDVKRFTALQQIEKVIDDIERNPLVEIVKVDFPVSQKNRFQKKGFIAYLKCGSAEEANLLHDELRVLMDPKWQSKHLFRINIALDQQRGNANEEEEDEEEEEERVGGGENTAAAAAGNNTETASQDSESTTESSSKASVESGEKEDYADYQPPMEHRAEMMEQGRPEYPVKTFHRYTLAPQYHYPPEFGYHNQHVPGYPAHYGYERR